jgi:hypothetical protein
VIIHDNEAIDDYPFIFHQEVHAIGDNVLVFILFQQWLPFQVSSSKELRILRDKGRHDLKLNQLALILVGGDAYAQWLRHNTNL